MTDEQRKRIHDITYSTDDREELAERIVAIEDENARLRSCLRDDAENARQIMGENAELRERYDEYESKMDGLVLRLTGGLLSKSAATPNDALYSVTMEQMTDELVGENFKMESENAKLRELARKYSEYTSQDRCEGCVCKSRCNDGDVDECWQRTEIREMERELGIDD